MNDLAILASICFIAMVSPGPDFVLVTRNSLKYPGPQAFATAVGIIVGCIIGASYCVLGLALVITKSVLLFSFVKYAGALYLIYIGIKGLISHSGVIDEQVGPLRGATITCSAAFIQGLLCNLLNPKLAVFLLSLFTQFLSVESTFVDKINVAGIFVLEAVIYWPIVVLILQSKTVRALFCKFQAVLDRICGALLIGLGVRVAFSRSL